MGEIVSALRNGLIDMRPARALLPIEHDVKTQRVILARMIAAELSTTQVSALVAEQLFGEAAVSPISFSVDELGKVEARTTAGGRLRVTLDATDKKALAKLWSALQKRM